MRTIGKKMRQLRLARDWTLADLAKHSKVALSTLSRIETSRMTGTLESHIRIAKALGVRLPELYADLEALSALEHRQGAGTDRVIAGKGASYALLTSRGLQKKMLPVLVNLGSKKSSQKEQGHAGSEKFVYLLKGKLEVTAGKERVRMKAGDSLYFQAALTHQLRNIGSGPAQAISISSPPSI